jgi:hypothetical protein
MDERLHIVAHVEAIATRTAFDTDRLAQVIFRRSWPSGSADRSEPSAAEWLRRWRPHTTGPALPACECVAGRCAVCN